MKPKFILAGLCAVTLLGLAAVTICALANPTARQSAADQRVFHVTGQIREVDAFSKTVRIAHEAIPGYMPAMTMPLEVHDPLLLRGLNPGDHVRFDLRVTADDSWISQIEKVASDDAPEQIANSGAAASSDRVAPGEAVPDFALIDQNGQPVRLRDFKGKAVVLTFIYTRCPLPNFCPLMSRNFESLQQRLEKTSRGRYHLLSLSIDPRFDRPEVLKEYASRYGAEEGSWTFATGTEEQINSVAGLFGLFREQEGGLINHDLRTALIGPDGRLVHLWKSNVWTPYEVQRSIQELLGNS